MGKGARLRRISPERNDATWGIGENARRRAQARPPGRAARRATPVRPLSQALRYYALSEPPEPAGSAGARCRTARPAVAARRCRALSAAGCPVRTVAPRQRQRPAAAPHPERGLRTKNRLRWQVLTVRGRLIWQGRCSGKGSLADQGCEQAKRKAGRTLANTLLNSTTSNRQNLPATGVFRARSPYAEQADGRQGSRGAADRAGSGRRRPLAQGRAGAGAPGGAHPLPHGRTRKHRASRASGRFAPTPQSKNQQRYARGLRGAGARNASTHRTKSAGASRCTLCPEP